VQSAALAKERERELVAAMMSEATTQEQVAEVESRPTDRRAPPPFPFFKDYPKPIQRLTSKFIKKLSLASKNHENFWADIGDQGEQLPFGSNFKIETYFELQIQKCSRIWI
jgi:hypothetical protein